MNNLRSCRDGGRCGTVEGCNTQEDSVVLRGSPIPRNTTTEHFVFKTMMRHGKVVKRKARLVVGGHVQAQGIDYEETFAHVVTYFTMRPFVNQCYACTSS